MNLYIQLENGQPINHPIMEDNLIQAFPEIDLNNLPENFARFERISCPLENPYEVYEGVTYEWDNGIVKDLHHLRPMTAEEKAAKQTETKEMWAEHGFVSWIFNEELCIFDPPVPIPADGNKYNWDESTLSWVPPVTE